MAARNTLPHLSRAPPHPICITLPCLTPTGQRTPPCRTQPCSVPLPALPKPTSPHPARGTHLHIEERCVDLVQQRVVPGHGEAVAGRTPRDLEALDDAQVTRLLPCEHTKCWPLNTRLANTSAPFLTCPNCQIGDAGFI